MKKFIIISLVTIILILTSCDGGGQGRFNILKSEREIAYETLSDVLNAIENNNSDELKSMFSEKALLKSKTLDKDIERLFDFYKGKSKELTIEDVKYPFVDSERGNKGEVVFFEQWDTVKTNEEKYVIDILHYTVNSKYPSKEGIQCIGIINKKDGDYPFIDVDEDIYGIYIAE